MSVSFSRDHRLSPTGENLEIPAEIVQGNSVTWRDISTQDNLGNAISSADWTLTYYFGGPTTLSVVSTAYSSGWETTLSAAQTAAMNDSQSAAYFWQATVTKATQVITIGSGSLRIVKNLATAVAGFDGRTQTEIDLAAVQAEISARISGGTAIEYTIGTRRLRKEDMAALLTLESSLKRQVYMEKAAQNIANGLGDPRQMYVRFR